MLLSLLSACQMYKELIPEKDQRKIAKKKIKALTEDSKMRKLLGNAIEEMQVVLMITTGAVT